MAASLQRTDLLIVFDEWRQCAFLSNTLFFGTRRVCCHGHLDRFSRFYRAHPPAQHTQNTERAKCVVNRPRLCDSRDAAWKLRTMLKIPSPFGFWLRETSLLLNGDRWTGQTNTRTDGRTDTRPLHRRLPPHTMRPASVTNSTFARGYRYTVTLPNTVIRGKVARERDWRTASG